jgi:hypothetical protein
LVYAIATILEPLRGTTEPMDLPVGAFTPIPAFPQTGEGEVGPQKKEATQNSEIAPFLIIKDLNQADVTDNSNNGPALKILLWVLPV